MEGFKEAENWAQQFDQTLNDLSALNPSQAKEFNDLKSSFDSYYTVGKKMAQAYLDGGPEAGNKIMNDFDQTALQINTKVDNFRQQALRASMSGLLYYLLLKSCHCWRDRLNP